MLAGSYTPLHLTPWGQHRGAETCRNPLKLTCDLYLILWVCCLLVNITDRHKNNARTVQHQTQFLFTNCSTNTWPCRRSSHRRLLPHTYYLSLPSEYHNTALRSLVGCYHRRFLTPCVFVDGYGRFGRSYCLHPQYIIIIIFIYCNWVVTRWQWKVPEAGDKLCGCLPDCTLSISIRQYLNSHRLEDKKTWLGFLLQAKLGYNNLYLYLSHRPSSWSSGQGLWLLIMRSRVRFPVLPWEFFLAGKDSRGDHGLGS